MVGCPRIKFSASWSMSQLAATAWRQGGHLLTVCSELFWEVGNLIWEYSPGFGLAPQGLCLFSHVRTVWKGFFRSSSPKARAETLLLLSQKVFGTLVQVRDPRRSCPFSALRDSYDLIVWDPNPTEPCHSQKTSMLSISLGCSKHAITHLLSGKTSLSFGNGKT